ncbi:MAG: helix-turn-helix domain-containing protein [SAR324 cluster bacterium]|nr:helix-turn-helix domain-containing protein [SAR324 cluster bacterium]
MVPTLDDIKIAWPVVANFLYPPQSREDYVLLKVRLDQLEHEAEEGSDLEILMDYLGELLDKYELAHFPEVSELDKEDVTPSEVLKRFMERNGLKQKDLSPIFGAQSRVSEVLNGKRQITLEQVKKLHESFGLPVSLFF